MSEPAATPAEALVARAINGLVPGDELYVTTDAKSYANLTKKPPVVLIAIARAKYALAMAIDAEEYDGKALANLCGWPDEVPPTAMELATAALDASSKRR